MTHAPDSQTPDEVHVLSVKFITAKYLNKLFNFKPKHFPGLARQLCSG